MATSIQTATAASAAGSTARPSASASASASASGAASTSTSAHAPIVPLAIHPATSLGPFHLGTTLYQLITFLRHPTAAQLFPKVQIVFDRRDPRRGPVVIQPCPGLSCIFKRLSRGREHRLQMIQLQLTDQYADVAVGDSTEDDDDDDGQSYDDEASRRRLDLSYRGQKLHVQSGNVSPSQTRKGRRGGGEGGGGGGARSNSTLLTRGNIQQLLGPTYPPKQHQPSEIATQSKTRPSEPAPYEKLPPSWILSYQGLAFLFDVDRSPSASAARSSSPSDQSLSKDAQPASMLVFAGDDPLEPEPVPWPVQSAASDQSVSDQDIWPGHQNSGIVCSKAVIKPLESLTLTLHAPPYSSASSITQLTLTLRQTTQQDALLNLGYPERRWTKTEGTSRPTSSGQARPSEREDDEADFSDVIPPEFWSYPSLGLDLLFSQTSTAPPPPPPLSSSSSSSINGARTDRVVLEKIIVHSDMPGNATWARSEFLPWVIENETGGADARGADIDTELSALPNLSSLSLPASNASRETMDLDRSADGFEFRLGLLKLDVRTKLRGFYRGAVAEVMPLRTGQGDEVESVEGEEKGIIVGWSIV